MIEAVKDAMVAALVEDRPMTVRQLFYRLVSGGMIDKAEHGETATASVASEAVPEGRIVNREAAGYRRW